jgi:hypothetical protein
MHLTTVHCLVGEGLQVTEGMGDLGNCRSGYRTGLDVALSPPGHSRQPGPCLDFIAISPAARNYASPFFSNSFKMRLSDIRHPSRDADSLQH